MTLPEFHAWREFYRAYPFDDLHRYHRPAALVSVAFGGGDIRSRIDWLQPDASTADLSDADMRTMAAMGFTRKAG